MLGVPMGGASSTAAPTGPLPTGTYYQFGSSSADPVYGAGWVAFTTAVVSDAARITVLEVRSARSISGWTIGAKYKGTNTDTYTYHDGATWQSMTNTEGFGFLPHVSYGDDVRSGTFSGVASATAWRCVMLESDTSGGLIGLNSSAVT